MKKQPRKPWNEQTTVEKVGTVITFIIGLGLIVFCCSAAISGVIQGVHDSNTADAQASATSAAQAATQTVQALTPSPTPTFVHHITDLVTHHKPDDSGSGLEGTITGAACNSAGVCHVDDTLPDAYDKVSIQRSAYAIFDALYNPPADSELHIQQLTINFFGNVQDKYGNVSKGMVAIAMLTKQTEKLFNWPNLWYQTAWPDYDQAEYLVGGL